MSDLGALGELGRTVAAKKATRTPPTRPYRRDVPPSRVGAVTGPVELHNAPEPQPTAAPQPAPGNVTITSDLHPVTVSLDEASERVLDAARTAGRFASPKVDANRSAVIRMLIARGAEQLTPGQLVAELAERAQSQPTNKTGRKRL